MNECHAQTHRPREDSRMVLSCASCKYALCTTYDTLISGPFKEKRRKPLSLHSLKQVKEPARLPYCYYHNSTRCFSWGDKLDPGIQKSSNTENPLRSCNTGVIPLKKAVGGWAQQIAVLEPGKAHSPKWLQVQLTP